MRRCFALVILLLFASGVQALPRYAARYEQNCNLCHVNPSGGGMRSLYASQFLLPQEMAADWLAFGDEFPIPDPVIGENLVVGADLRTLYTAGDADDAEPENFFQMQSDLYLEFTLGDRFALYMDRGQSNSYESYGIAHVLPYAGYLKIGRFTPAFGWKHADHNRSTRALLGYLPPSHSDVGVEVGFHPGSGNLQLSLLNGEQGSPLDGDADLAYAARGEYRFGLGALRLAAGGSFHYLDRGMMGTWTGGGFGYARWGRLIWMGEADWRTTERTTEDLQAFVSSQELAFSITRGVDALVSWDFHDLDLDIQNGAKRRLGFGVDALLNPMAGLRAMFFVHDEDPDENGFAHDYEQLEVVAHFLY